MRPIISILIAAGILAAIFFLSSGEKPSVSPKNNVDMIAEEKAGLEKVQGETVAYFNGISGYFARPEEDGDYPGVVMIHEWWGLNENIKEMAKELASEGYLVLAVDLFGKVAGAPEDARAQVSLLDQGKAIENMKAAAAFLRKKGAAKIASLGWCFGGGQSLKLALSGEKLSATIIYYGNLETDKSKLSAVRWPVLGIFGDKDASIPVSKVNEFKEAISALGINNEIHVYPGVGHAFANPSGANYAPNETKDAWEKTLAFLAGNLKK
jgi:carboxymethylenebutenolidase